MKVSHAIDVLKRLVMHNRDLDLVVQTYSPGSIGPLPSVPVKDLQAGIDWDSGRVLIYPEQRLTTLTAEQVDAIMTSVRKGQSWHAYQREKHHMEEIKRLRARLRELGEP